MRSRRKASAFSLSFLDIMSCGFGAVVLLFLIIKHNVEEVPSPVPARDLTSEVTLLEKEIRDGEENLAELRNTIDEVADEMVTAEGRARRIQEEIEEAAGNIEELSADTQTAELEKLKQDLVELQKEKQRLEAETEETGDDVRSFVGEGNRQYLTGLRLGGRRILVLLDASASMLDETIVNIIRRRNMSDEVKRNSAKWQQAVRMVDWLSTQFPPGSQYQIFTFNAETESVLPDSNDDWLQTGDSGQLNRAIEAMADIIPAGGTSLENAFIKAAGMQPLPDNIYLITDGLPTQGRTAPRGTTVTGRQRLQLYDQAIRRLPANIPVNIILAPIEGDPISPSAFWQLAVATQGSFLSPTRGWP